MSMSRQISMSDIIFLTVAAFLISFIAIYLICSCGSKEVESKPKVHKSSSNVATTKVSKHVRDGLEERIRLRMAKRE